MQNTCTCVSHCDIVNQSLQIRCIRYQRAVALSSPMLQFSAYVPLSYIITGLTLYTSQFPKIRQQTTVLKMSTGRPNRRKITGIYAESYKVAPVWLIVYTFGPVWPVRKLRPCVVCTEQRVRLVRGLYLLASVASMRLILTPCSG